MEKTNLFVVGAAKAGTSSLWELLGSHPEIYVPEDELNKEPSYFCEYGAWMGLENYEQLFESGSGCRYRCDASTAYLTAPEAAKRIHDYNPDAKIIIIVRNPVDRAYSLYNWMVQDGYEWAPSFEKAVRLEEKRKKNFGPKFLQPQYFWNYMYLTSGLYSSQIERYKVEFGENVLLLTFEELIAKPDVVLDKVYEFLGVAPQPTTLKKSNESKRVMHSYVSFFARKMTNFLHRLGLNRHARTKKGRDFLLEMVCFNGRPSPLKKETRAKLTRFYAEEFRRLKSMHGIDYRA